jgi:hypothetical protein
VFDIRLTYLIFNLIYVMKSDGEWRERKKARDSGSMLPCSHHQQHAPMLPIGSCPLFFYSMFSSSRENGEYNDYKPIHVSHIEAFYGPNFKCES